MKRSFFSILVFFLFSVSLYSQIVDTILTVESKGKINLTATTEIGHKYIIIVEGTYSMWPEYTDSTGVDAVYIYKVPKAQITAKYWPDSTDLSLPRWVGDDSTWQTPKYLVHPRKYTGFRLDDEPLKRSEMTLSSNRYQLEKAGTGKPFSFKIIDSVLDRQTQKMVGGYGDNCGKLTVTVIDITHIIPPSICDIQTVCDANGKIIGLQVMAAIFKLDSTNIHGKRNILRDIDIRQLGLMYNGKFICPYDTECIGDTTKPVTIGILVDRSGSMTDPISSNDPTQKMTASKKSINGFIDHFKPADSAFIMTFANNYTLDQNWTHNKDLLKATINNIIPNGSTNLFDAILFSLDKISISATENRALVVLSDGMSNEGSPWSTSILDKIAQKNIPIYIVALGYQPGDLAARKNLEDIASRTLGKVFDVDNASKLDSVYEKLAIQVREGDCCTIKFEFTDSCNTSGENYLRLIYTPGDTTYYSQVVKFACTCDTTIKKPAKPTLISPKNKAVNVPINTPFIWKKAQYATEYQLEYSTKSDLSNPFEYQYSDTTATRDLDPGTKYYWRVKGINSQYDGDYSDTWEFTTNADTLGKPILISPEDQAVGVDVPTKFLWHKVNKATRYELSYYIQSNAPNYNPPITIKNDTTYTDKTLSNPSKYYWKVKAYNDTDTSAWSDKWRFTTQDKVVLRKPDNGAVDISNTTTFNWDPVSNSDVYEMQRGKDSTFKVIITTVWTNTNSNTIKIDTISNLNKYFWRVRSINLIDKDTTYWSDTWHFTTKYFAPPQLKTPIDESTGVSTKTTFEWYSVTDATKYDLQVSKTSDFKSISKDTIGITSTNFYLYNDLQVGTTYYWRVKAKNATDESNWSLPWSYTTTPVGIIDTKLQDVNLYPNPADNKAQLSINYTETCDAKISISNAEGKIIKTEPIRILQGDNRYEINTKNWNSGSYYITITTPSGYITKELVVTK
jgi:hypothetical protein